LDRDIFAHYLGLILGLGLEPLASALASRCLASLTSLVISHKLRYTGKCNAMFTHAYIGAVMM